MRDRQLIRSRVRRYGLVALVMSVTTAVSVPDVRTGAYVLANVDATYAVARNLELAIGLKNLLDDNYQLAWGFPAQGRTFYIKTKMKF